MKKIFIFCIIVMMFTLVGCADVGNSENVGVNENVDVGDVYTNNATFTPLKPIGM